MTYLSQESASRIIQVTVAAMVVITVVHHWDYHCCDAHGRSKNIEQPNGCMRHGHEATSLLWDGRR